MDAKERLLKSGTPLKCKMKLFAEAELDYETLIEAMKSDVKVFRFFENIIEQVKSEGYYQSSSINDKAIVNRISTRLFHLLKQKGISEIKSLEHVTRQEVLYWDIGGMYMSELEKFMYEFGVKFKEEDESEK